MMDGVALEPLGQLSSPLVGHTVSLIDEAGRHVILGKLVWMRDGIVQIAAFGGDNVYSLSSRSYLRHKPRSWEGESLGCPLCKSFA